MTELIIGLACFIFGMLVMFIIDQIEYGKLSKLSEKTFESTFNSLLEILRITQQSNDDLFWKNLTWICEACRKVRPDDKISVYHHPWNLGGVESHQNLKYCNDNPNCLEMVKTHDLFALRKMAKENEDE